MSSVQTGGSVCGRSEGTSNGYAEQQEEKAEIGKKKIK